MSALDLDELGRIANAAPLPTSRVEIDTATHATVAKGQLRALVDEVRRLTRERKRLVDAGDAMADLIDRVGDAGKDAHMLKEWAAASAEDRT